ncbi:polyketide synthase [Apiospora saccharicola]|uniref:Polyketide synthase n=1 Tax=Apiospora saccharicola TaxID=335842 RepID=A0ABR1TNM3_9PEZI
MSDAIADGNQILGCISSTAVYQNENCTPVFVPNSPSLSYLFKEVLNRARMEPRSISVVEAHGTGTPVGDPVEYEIVFQALGGASRNDTLALGSVKGLVGHTEGASGVVSLIKIILMIQQGFIPPQASFETMSHHIRADPADRMEIVTKLRSWDSDFRAALINNYGASGSNASMIVTQPLHRSLNGSGHTPIHAAGLKHPFRPVVMCFGGQTSTFVGLDRGVYDSVKILRSYLDQCNAVFLSIGLEGIYPGIFQSEPVNDPIQLQTMLFAMQYACAKSWMDSAVQVSAVVGHSFGELTALSISGVLSLKDTAKLIASRARLVRDSWGADRGAMLAIEADLDLIHSLTGELHPDVTIACYNGPRSFTLAGPTEAIDNLAGDLPSNPTFSTRTRFKKLNVTNAFHSTLVEPLLEPLGDIGKSLTFREPIIPLERSTEELDMDMPPDYVAQHMRNPVYFNHAVQRLASQYPEAVWLEAGSNLTITTMASRALDHAGQTYEYDHIFLPPYQFEKVKHWMDLKKPQKTVAHVEVSSQPIETKAITSLWSFLGFQDKKERSARFRINTETEKYQSFVLGHWIAQTAPICPATLEVDMVIEALMSIRPDFKARDMHPIIQNMQNHAPICVDPSRLVYIDYQAIGSEGSCWDWKIISVGQQSNSTTEHVHGKILFRPVEDPDYQAEFDRYGRFFSHKRCLDILETVEADDIIHGRNIYKTFAEIVDYGEQYRGLKRLVGVGSTSAGRVCKSYSRETWLDTHLTDCFSQVGGIWVNCMTTRAHGDMYIASGCDLVMRSPKVRETSPRPEVWDVLAYHHPVSDKAYTTDIFVFDGSNGQLVEIMLGINYAKVAKASMQKILARLSPGVSPPSAPVVQRAELKGANISSGKGPETSVTTTPGVKPKKELKKGPKLDVKNMARNLLANLSGLEHENILEDTELADIGIDSLMGMELAREVEAVFSINAHIDT